MKSLMKAYDTVNIAIWHDVYHSEFTTRYFCQLIHAFMHF